jgi:hypothetical protein
VFDDRADNLERAIRGWISNAKSPSVPLMNEFAMTKIIRFWPSGHVALQNWDQWWDDTESGKMADLQIFGLRH